MDMEENPAAEEDKPKRDPSKVINIEQELLRDRKIFLVGPIDDRSAKVGPGEGRGEGLTI
eukprot:750608-Hanusia_phi.AAC.4